MWGREKKKFQYIIKYIHNDLAGAIGHSFGWVTAALTNRNAHENYGSARAQWIKYLIDCKFYRSNLTYFEIV